MSASEREAAQEAVKREREHWLPVLRRRDPPVARMLGLPPRSSPEAIERRRQQTREHVRRYRQRQLQATE